MTQKRDERPLAKIQFALGEGEEQSKVVRNLLQACGVEIAQDIIEAGCTGLFLLLKDLPLDPLTGPLYEASFIRQRMSGSICGLPCYVPRDRYCLIHDTIGGLQVSGNHDGPQAVQHSEALPFMSRELTEEERKKVLGVEAKIAADAKAQALAEYGIEEIDLSESAPSCPIPQPPFKCPDHKEPDWTCRKCIAQAIVEDEGDLECSVKVWRPGAIEPLHHHGFELIEAQVELAADRLQCVELWVGVASWSKKVTRD